MAYETQYDRMGRPIGSYWVNPGETLDDAIARNIALGHRPTSPDDPALYQFSGTQPMSALASQASPMQNPSPEPKTGGLEPGRPPSAQTDPSARPWGTPAVDNDPGGFRLRLWSPQAGYRFSRNIGEIDQLIAAGHKVIRDDGAEALVDRNWQGTGGSTIDSLPVNTVLTGRIAPEQKRALQQAGQWLTEWDQIPVDSLPSTLPNPQQPPPPPPKPGTGGLSVRINGAIRQFQRSNDTELDRVLKAGGVLIDPLTGEDLIATPNVYGGYLFHRRGSSIALPLNVIGGEGWAPDQRAALQGYFEAGWRPGMPALVNPPTPKGAGATAGSTGGAPGGTRPAAGKVRMVNRTTGTTHESSDPVDIDNFLKSGFQLVNAAGKPYDVQDFQGGRVFKDPDTGEWAPLNVLMGGSWTDAQRAAQPEFQKQAPGAVFAGQPQGGAAGGTDLSGFGALAKGFTEPFSYPALPLSSVARPFTERFDGGGVTFPTYVPRGTLPEPFTGDSEIPDFAFTEADLYKDPGYQFRVSEMDRALSAQHSAKANDPMGGRALREIARYRGGLASQEFGAAYERAQMEHALRNAKSQEEYSRLLQQYGLAMDRSSEDYQRGVGDFSLAQMASGEAYGRAQNQYLTRFDIDRTNQQRTSDEYARDYGRAFGEYGTRFDIDRANKTDIYNRFAGLSGTGQVAGGALGSLGQNFAGQQSNAMMGNARSLAELWGYGANAQAAGRVGSANAWAGAFGNTADSLADLYVRSRARTPTSTQTRTPTSAQT